MAIDSLLQRLDKVKRTGRDKWSACCPAHDDRGPSLAVKELDDGRILLHCFAGCGAGEVLGAIGMDFADLFPTVSTFHSPRVRKPWNAGDVLTGIAYEVLLAYAYASKMAQGVVLSTAEQDRLLTCASRLQRGLEACNG